MDSYNLGSMPITADINYFNCDGGSYSIGLTIGGFYTILRDSFKTEEEAKRFIQENILNYYDRMWEQ